MIRTGTTPKGHKIHVVANGWAACGAGRIAIVRDVEQGDQPCKTCCKRKSLLTQLGWERDDMMRLGRRDHVAHARFEWLHEMVKDLWHVVYPRPAWEAEMMAEVAARWEKAAEPVQEEQLVQEVEYTLF